MADDLQSNTSRRSRKFHEGWLHIKEKGNWTKYWAVLRGQTIYFFHSDKPNEKNHVGTLYLDGQTETKSRPPEGLRKKVYKLELYTNNPVRKFNQFKFEKENNRDVWKSFIMGVSTGRVPKDVKILPGQLKDVVEAIGDVMNTPPPLPSLPRPRVHPANHRDFNQPSQSERSWGSGSEESETGSGSFGTHITQQAKYNRSKSVPQLEIEDVPNLRSLYRRQSELAMKTLGRDRGRSPPRGGGGGRDSSDGEDYGSESSSPWTDNFSIGSPPPKSVRSQNVTTFSELDDLEWGGESVLSGLSGRAASPPPLPPPLASRDRPLSPTLTPRGRSMSPPPVSSAGYPTGRRPTDFDRQPSMHPPPPRQNSDYGSSHSEIHQFYTDSKRNREHPPWFFENTSREVAESILTMGKRFGNVLMRESVTFKNTGSYVISMRREVAGGTQLNHYEVKKTPQGFKINVDNEHRPMRCLHDVMDFFVRQAGPGTSPLRTNNLSTLGLNVPPGGRRGPIDDAPDSGVEDDDVRSNSSQPHAPPHVPRTPQRPNPGKMHLNVSGNVPGEMHQTAMEIEYTMKKSTPKWDESRLSMPPAPPPPPPPPGGLVSPPPPPPPPMGASHDFSHSASYGDSDSRSRGAGPPPEGGFSDPNLNRTVPPRLPPTETLQRTGGHHELYYNNQREQSRVYRPSSPETDYGSDPFDSPSGGAPPPPPPMMGMGGPPAMGGPPPPPLPGSDSPPPPAAPGSLQAMLAASALKPVSAGGAQTARRPSDTSSQSSGSAGFSTTPGRPRGAMGGGPPSFEDELKKRLVAQREDVYASGATILKSNWRDT